MTEVTKKFSMSPGGNLSVKRLGSGVTAVAGNASAGTSNKLAALGSRGRCAGCRIGRRSALRGHRCRASGRPGDSRGRCSPTIGGTTANPQGAYWIPNNQFMRAAGTTDPKMTRSVTWSGTDFPARYREICQTRD